MTPAHIINIMCIPSKKMENMSSDGKSQLKEYILTPCLWICMHWSLLCYLTAKNVQTPHLGDHPFITTLPTTMKWSESRKEMKETNLTFSQNVQATQEKCSSSRIREMIRKLTMRPHHTPMRIRTLHH